MIKQLIRYGITSSGGLIFNLLLLSALVEVGGLDEIIAAATSAGVTLLLTFTIVQGWVFNQHQAQSRQIIAKRASMYYIVMIISKIVNIVIYSFLLWLNVWYLVAWIIGSGTVFGGTFIMNRYVWTKTAS
jgi:putative flippase GtrA